MADERKELGGAPRIEREWPSEEHERNDLPDAIEDEVLTQDMEALRITAQAPSVAPTASKDSVVLSVESILSENLGDLYRSLPESERGAFKRKGEEVALAIAEMVQSGKFVIEKVMDLIRSWLRVVTGINLYYVEQEVKIKADLVAEFFHARLSTTV